MSIWTLKDVEEIPNLYVCRLQNSQTSLRGAIQNINAPIQAFEHAFDNPSNLTANTYERLHRRYTTLCDRRKSMIKRLDTLSQQLAVVTDIGKKMRKSMTLDCKLQCAERMWIDMQLQLLIDEKKDNELLEDLKHTHDSQLNDHTWMQQQIQASHRRVYNTTPNPQSDVPDSPA